MVKSIPKSENGHGVYIKRNKNNYIVTLNNSTMRFTLWKIVESGKAEEYDKIGTADNPFKLYEKIDKLEND